MMSRSLSHSLSLAVALVAGIPATASAQVSAEQIFKYTPKQPGVDFETPNAAEIKQCRVEIEKVGRSGSGYALYGPAGQILRRFEDSDGDQKLDRYRYYKFGLEVYRDIDTNGDEKMDQFRWMNTNGTRWGIDTNGDMKIDRWNRLSAEEASREAVNALVSGDVAAMKTLMVTPADVQSLGLNPAVAQELLALSKDITGDMQRSVRAGKLTRATKWSRFDSSMLTPQLIPAESNKTDRDVVVYENVMAIIETGQESNYLQVGEVIQIGNVWKLTQVPRPIDSTTGVIAGGVLMQPDIGPAATGGPSMSPAMQALVDQLTKLDENVPGASSTPKERIDYNKSRAAILGKIANATTNSEDQEAWKRQQIEVITAATQGNAYPEGIAELKQIEQTVGGTLKPFVAYRRILAEYTERLLSSGEDERAAQQDWLLKELEGFLARYPKSMDASEAMWQLGSALELSEKVTDARKWYGEAVKNFQGTPAAELASGALRRLSLRGQKLTLSGPTLGGGKADIAQYKGKVTAVIYWATWNSDLTAALPDVKALYQKYRAKGFEILGVNTDGPGAPVDAYIKQQQIPWANIAEQKGLESPTARQYGIFVLPHIILVNRQGVVVDPAANLTDLQTVVPRLLLDN